MKDILWIEITGMEGASGGTGAGHGEKAGSGGGRSAIRRGQKN